MGGVFPLVANAAVEDNVGGMSEDVAKENLSEQLDRIDEGDGTDVDEDASYYSSSTDIDGIRESGTSSSGTLIADANDILYGKLAIIKTGETVKVVTGKMPNYAGKTKTASTVTENEDNVDITVPNIGYYTTGSKLSVSVEKLKSDISALNTRAIISAINAKNVSLDYDASNAEIAEAIASIKQTITNNELKTGTISYEYHYHTNASGTKTDATTQTAKGGCYTNANYHSHTNSCYTETRHYTASAYHACPLNHCNGVCNDCGGHLAGNSAHKHGGYFTTTQLTCTKGGTITSYSLSCGRSYGEIVKATITY